MERCGAIEAWWWTGDLAADFGQPAWLDQAAANASRLASRAGDYEGILRREAGQRLDHWCRGIG
jgi:hypothetical protein